MYHIVVPTLYCPFPHTLNPHVEAAQQHVNEWVQQFHLLPSQAAYARFQAAKFAWLAARAYPTAEFNKLRIVTDWNVWLFIHDDQCDESGIGKRPTQLAQLYDQFRGILFGGTPSQNDTSLTHALHELWQRICRHSNAEWRHRFLISVEDYFYACIWEAENRMSRRIPDIASYTQMRPFAGALNTDIELIELCEGVILPAAVYRHPIIKRLTLMCNNAVCWANDILSLQKELNNGDMHNLVIVLQHEQQCSWQEAVDRVADMHNNEVLAFEQLSKQLPSFSPEIDTQIARYIDILRAWMRGNIDWALDTGRYANEQHIYAI
jgi:hypothetical protein